MFLGESLFPLARNASNVDANQCINCKEGNLFMQATLRKKLTHKNKAKQMPWAEITNYNLPKTQNVWIFENCFRADIRNNTLIGAPDKMRAEVTKEGAALNKGKWRQISSGDTQNNKTQPRKRGKPLKRPNRNHQYQWNDQSETAETSEATKTGKNTE